MTRLKLCIVNVEMMIPVSKGNLSMGCTGSHGWITPTVEDEPSEWPKKEVACHAN